jgi:hypothetical protein
MLGAIPLPRCVRAAFSPGAKDIEMSRTRSTSWVSITCVLVLAACAQPRSAGEGEPGSRTPRLARDARAPSEVRGIRVVAVEDDAPQGGDGAPRMTLAFELADGTERAIEGQATAYARFRDGVALVDRERRLVLVTADGARRVLAQQSGAPPVQGPGGELAYVARYGLVAELHVLRPDGRDRIVASGLADAGTLVPQRDGSVLFVGARPGGVAGVWRASAEGQTDARCLTNCELRTGTDWSDRFVALPTDAAAMQRQAEQAEAPEPAVLAPVEPTGATR